MEKKKIIIIKTTTPSQNVPPPRPRVEHAHVRQTECYDIYYTYEYCTLSSRLTDNRDLSTKDAWVQVRGGGRTKDSGDSLTRRALRFE